MANVYVWVCLLFICWVCQAEAIAHFAKMVDPSAPLQLCGHYVTLEAACGMGLNVLKYSLHSSTGGGAVISSPFRPWLSQYFQKESIYVPALICCLVIALPFSVSSCPHFTHGRQVGDAHFTSPFYWGIHSTKPRAVSVDLPSKGCVHTIIMFIKCQEDNQISPTLIYYLELWEGNSIYLIRVKPSWGRKITFWNWVHLVVEFF